MARVIVNGGAVLSRSLLPPGDLLPVGAGQRLTAYVNFLTIAGTVYHKIVKKST